jgi:hypothetical protein
MKRIKGEFIPTVTHSRENIEKAIKDVEKNVMVLSNFRVSSFDRTSGILRSNFNRDK